VKLSDKNYNHLKWVVTIFLPAFGTLLGTIGTTVNWAYTQLVLVILTAITTFLGTLLGVSTYNYKKEE
jgi:uncharacterized membrane protein